MKNSHRTHLAALAAIGALAAAPQVASAASVTASETINGGSLAFINSTPANVTFPNVSLNGTSDQNVTRAQGFDVNDATGSGSGWNITATSTTFSTGGGTPSTLPTGATTIQTGPTVGCDSGVTCTTANSNSVTYPYTLPAASTAPTATRIFSAGANSGMAAQTITPTWQLNVPVASKAGAYSSTWTLSLVSAP